MAEVLLIDPQHPRLGAVLGVMQALREQRTLEELHDLYAAGHDDSGYRLAALFDDEDECRAAAGYRMLTSFDRGHYMYVDDLVTAPEQRSRGYGAELLGFLKELAIEHRCAGLDLDSGTHREDAHRFYFREGLTIRSFHFTTEL